MHFVLAAALAIAGGLDVSRPPTLFDRSSAQPIFIPAADIVDTSGNYTHLVPKPWRELNDSRTHDQANRRLKATHSEESCEVEAGEIDVEQFVSRRDGNETVRNATAIFYGRVTAVTPGLFYGASGSLLELREVQVIKRGPYDRVDDVLYVRHPYARFTINETEYCRLSADDRNRPRVGDEVLVFAFDRPLDQSGTFVHAFKDDLVLAGDHRLLIPPVFREFAGRDDAFEAIRAMAQRYYVQERRRRVK